MSTARAARTVVLPPHRAVALWTDVSRWPTFIEGFAHEVQRDDAWPAKGSKLVWESTPGGRGRVTEKVLSRDGTHLASRILEHSLSGVQTVRFSPADDGGTEVALELEYELNPTTVWRQGPIGKVTDLFFIRRALTDSLARTLRRFATEAEEEQAL